MTTNKTNTTVTANNAKVDFFSSSRELSLRTAEYFRVVIHKAEIKAIFAAKIESTMNSIAGINDMLANNTQIDISKEKLEEMLANYTSILTSLEEEQEKQLKEEACFAWTDTDKSFKKCVAKAEKYEQVLAEVRAWYKHYGLVIDNTTFETAVMNSIGQKTNVKTMVKSNGTKALVYDASNALKNLYAVGFEWMVEAGTIKPAQIPSVLRDKYTKTKKNSKKDEKKVA